MHYYSRPLEQQRTTRTHAQQAEHLALLYEISHTLIASGNLDDLLSQLLDRTVAVVGATHGSIIVLERNPLTRGHVIVAGAGLLSSAADLERVLHDGVAGYVITTKQIALIDDVRNDVRWVRSVIDDAPVAPRSALVVPLLHSDDVIGVLTLWHAQIGYFDTDAAELINAVAAQAAMAIARATAYEQAQRRADELDRLYREREILYAQERQHSSELAMLYDAALDIASGPHLNDVLQRLAERATHLVHAESACVYLMNETQNGLIIAAVFNRTPIFIGRQLHLNEGLAGRAAVTRRIEMVANYREWSGKATRFPNEHCHMVIAVPLICADQVVGVLNVIHGQPESWFSARDVQLLEMLGAQAAVTVMNMRLNADLQRSNAELAVASRLKSEFLATVSHELRTPLNAIIGYTDMIVEGFFGPLTDELSEPLERVQRNARNLLNLINDVLDLSMIEAGYMHLVQEQYDIDALVQASCADALHLARERNLYFRVEIAADLPPVRGDLKRVRQIIYHLVANAVKFTEQGGVTVRVSRVQLDSQLLRGKPTADGQAPAALLIEIADTGIGIPPEFQQVIFEAFRQVDGSATRRYGGSGLGLAMVQRLVRLMGGYVALESQVNVGSTFRVFLPLN